MSQDPPKGDNCYCNGNNTAKDFLQCQICKVWYHTGCLKSGSPSWMNGDTYFSFTCSICNSTEICERIPLKWMQVIWLALRTLQHKSLGKLGYYHWKDDVCSFIDKNWNFFFGISKNKSGNWQGTVAGVLSSNCPRYFISGYQTLTEAGYWMAAEEKPPSHTEKQGNKTKNTTKEASCTEENNTVKKTRGRRGNVGSLKAAMQRKAEQSEIHIPKRKRKKYTTIEMTSATSVKQEENSEMPSTTSLVTLPDIAVTQIKTEPVESDMGNILPMMADSDSDLDIDPCAVSPTQDHDKNDEPQPVISDIIGSLKSTDQKDFFPGMNEDFFTDKLKTIKKEPSDYTPTPEDSQTGSLDSYVDEEPLDSEEDYSATTSVVDDHSVAPSVVDEEVKKNLKTETKPKPRARPMCLYEEKMLLQKVLQVSNASKVADSVAFRQLKRKLLVRQQKREYSQPVFDLDKKMCELCNCETTQTEASPTQMFPSIYFGRNIGAPRLLDRFQNVNVGDSSKKEYISFLTRLVGTEDDQLQSVRSPYTSRVLKPFIRRDYECFPRKLQLLQEIQQYSHKSDKTWQPEPLAPIDYCYVRPQHIPSVNALCGEFFWPGIDLSECLQYPDFSCIVLYKHLVIGFGFMVPDVKYNEAYISFLFTHPEWRGAGIATFTLYHLIQTCMGKDVTLHVSVSNPALLLYQKFGFKPEEYIINFYDKYFPVESKECRHAFFVRLKR